MNNGALWWFKFQKHISEGVRPNPGSAPAQCRLHMGNGEIDMQSKNHLGGTHADHLPALTNDMISLNCQQQLPQIPSYFI